MLGVSYLFFIYSHFNSTLPPMSLVLLLSWSVCLVLPPTLWSRFGWDIVIHPRSWVSWHCADFKAERVAYNNLVMLPTFLSPRCRLGGQAEKIAFNNPVVLSTATIALLLTGEITTDKSVSLNRRQQHSAIHIAGQRYGWYGFSAKIPAYKTAHRLQQRAIYSTSSPPIWT